jgi:hypothetical protein
MRNARRGISAAQSDTLGASEESLGKLRISALVAALLLESL